jgi:hypothetical protein
MSYVTLDLAAIKERARAGDLGIGEGATGDELHAASAFMCAA